MTPSKSQARQTSEGEARTNGKRVSMSEAEPASTEQSSNAKKPSKPAATGSKGASGTAKGAKKAPSPKAAPKGTARAGTAAADSPTAPRAGTKAGAGRSKAPAKPTPAAAHAGAARTTGGAASQPAPSAPSRDAPAAKAAAPREDRSAARPAPAKPYADDARFLEEQRELLDTERSVYKGQAADLKAEADSLAEDREPGDVQFDEESGEGGTVTVDRERDLALSAQALAAVEEIDEAMGRIDLGTYGACERCQQPIPKSRLRALPFARLCVACKSGGLSRR